MLPLAHEFQIDKLLSLCEQQLIHMSMSIKHVLLADNYGLKKLMGVLDSYMNCWKDYHENQNNQQVVDFRFNIDTQHGATCSRGQFGPNDLKCASCNEKPWNALKYLYLPMN